MKTFKLFLFILFLIRFSYSFKLNYTLFHSINRICFLSENLIASGSDDGSIKTWDLKDQKLKFTFDKKTEDMIQYFL